MRGLNQKDQGAHDPLAVVTCGQADGTGGKTDGQGLDQEDTEADESQQEAAVSRKLRPEKGKAGWRKLKQ